MFLVKNNNYILIRLELLYERCKITENTGRGESIGQVTEDHRAGKEIPYERITDQAWGVWIRTQIASEGS